ncbi:MAG: hypothetical protein ACFFD2_04420, partial [Promethearchaeota archaeon]
MIYQITCTKILQEINTQIKHSNKSYLLIFDLDDTVFNTIHRKFYIYKNFLRKKFSLPKITLDFHKNYYNFLALLENNIIFQENKSEILKLYTDLFLSESFLSLDKPFFGVESFIQKLSVFKIQVVFLTGRPSNSMKKGTYAILNKYELLKHPNEENYLFMKKNPKKADLIFKKMSNQDNGPMIFNHHLIQKIS